MTRLVAVRATPGSESPIKVITRSAQSVTSRTVGCFRYRRRRVRAAFFFTKVVEVLVDAQLVLTGWIKVTYWLIIALYTFSLNASAISLPPRVAIACSARQLFTSLWSSRSFLIELITSRAKSEPSCMSRVRAR